MPNILKLIKGALKKRRPEGMFPPISWINTKIIKHEEDQQIKQRKIGPLHIHYIKPYELLHTYEDLFVKEIYRFSSSNERPLILDCGSNIGLSILYFKTLFPNAIVHGYEPDPQNHRILKLNMEGNHLQDVHLHQEAVWIHDEGISFSGAGTEASRIGGENDKDLLSVPTTRLSDILKSHKRIDFLKMDIEGAEYEVIKDCGTDLHVVDNLFLEYHGKSHETEKLITMLGIVKDQGFEVYIKNAADLMLHPFMTKRTPYAFDVQLNIFCYKP